MNLEMEAKLYNLKNKLMSFFKGTEISSAEPEIERVPLSADPIDLDAAMEMDRESQVEFGDTDNSSPANGAPKVIPKGIDRFGERPESINT
jgi:hypothetical protein